VDDAHIFLAYGQNIAQGHGFVYLPGGERVEGYSSSLWTLLAAVACALTARPQIGLLVAGIVFVSLALTALWRWLDDGPRVTWRGLLFLAWVFSSPSFILWTSISLMDTALWSSILIFAVIAAVSGNAPRRLSVWILLALLARPEAMLWGPVLIGLAGLGAATQRGVNAALREARLPIAVYLVVLAMLTAFRMVYFGYPLPNTYYAKMSPDILYNMKEGFIYLASFLWSNLQIIVVLLGTLTGLVLYAPRFVALLRAPSTQASDRARVQFVLVSIVALIGLLVPVFTGGDHFKQFRFYQPVWPLLFLAPAGLIRVLRHRIPDWGEDALVLIVAILLFAAPSVNWGTQHKNDCIRIEFEIAEDGAQLGTTLNALFKEDPPSIGVIIAGAIAFTYQGDVIDAMGLNNVTMAHTPGPRHGIKNHAAFNRDVLLAQRPDLFFPIIGPGRKELLEQRRLEHDWANKIFKGLLDDEAFLAVYEHIFIRNSDRSIMVYVHQDYLPRLTERGLDWKAVDP